MIVEEIVQIKCTSDRCPNPFNIKEAVKFLVNRFNDVLETQKRYESIDETYFDDYETIKSGVKKSIEQFFF